MSEEIYKQLRNALIGRLENLGFTFRYLYDEYRESGVPSWISFNGTEVSLERAVDYQRDSTLFDVLVRGDNKKAKLVLENLELFIGECIAELGFETSRTEDGNSESLLEMAA